MQAAISMAEQFGLADVIAQVKLKSRFSVIICGQKVTQKAVAV